MVPVLCGFVPTESLVVVALHGPRKRIGLTMRFDLDWALLDPRAAADEVAGRLGVEAAARAVLVVLSERADPVCGGEPAELVGTGLVQQVRDACAGSRIAVDEALLVRNARWWAYLCRQAGCCPADGTPLPERPTPALQLVEAEQVLSGRAVLASRQQLAESIAAPSSQLGAAAVRHVQTAQGQWDRRRRLGRAAQRAHGLGVAAALVGGAEAGETVTGPRAAQLAVALQDVLVRDEIATWCLDRPEHLLSVLVQTARQVPPPQDAPVLALLGWVAYAQGDGGLANVALERCLTSDPECSLAHLLGEMLARQVPPREVRRVLHATRDAPPGARDGCP